MQLFDSHAHYNDKKFTEIEGGRDGLLEYLFANGVEYILNSSCDLEDSLASIKLAEIYPNMYASVGIHPHESGNYSYDSKKATLDSIAEMLKHEKAVAMGEMGLDFHYDFSDREHQFFWFESQLGLARELDVPVIIHDREAHGPTMDCLNKYKGVRGVLHSFSGSAEMAAELLKMGFYISFSGVITFKNANGVLRALETVPLDRLLIETDAPYLAPIPYRGKVNNSGYMIETAKKAAEVKGVEVETLINATKNNAKELFGI